MISGIKIHRVKLQATLKTVFFRENREFIRDHEYYLDTET